MKHTARSSTARPEALRLPRWRPLADLYGLLLLVALWWVAARFTAPYLLPGPEAVFGALPQYLNPATLHNLALTLYRVLAGFTAAFVLGTLLGVAAFVLGLTAALNSFMLALQAIPGLILGIICLIALGVGNGVPIALVAIVVLPTIAINTSAALNRRSLALEQYLVSAGARRRDVVRYLYLPTLVPTLQSNLIIGFGMAFKVVVLGEFIGAQDGLGYLLNVAMIYLNMKEVLFYLCVVLLITAVFEVAQAFLFRVTCARYFYPE